MKNASLTLLFLFSLFEFSNAQQSEQILGSITGTVVDSETLEPLIGVNLIIEKTLEGNATNANGEYIISKLTPGIYTLTIRYIGYETKRIPDIVVGANRSQIVDIKLNPSTVMGDEITVTSGYFTETSSTQGIGKVSFTPEEIRRSPERLKNLGEY